MANSSYGLPMAQQQQGNPHQDDEPIWIAGAILVATVGLWWLLRPWVARWVLIGRGWIDTVILWIDPHAFGPRVALQMRAGYALSEWDLHNLDRYASHSMWVLNPILMLILAGWTWRRGRANPVMRMRRTFNRESLVRYMLPAFPWSLPVLGKDLVHTSIHEGPWRMARRPFEIARDHRLFQGRSLSVSKTEAFWKTQMGATWLGLDVLPRSHQALLGAFCAQVLESRQTAKRLLESLVRLQSTGEGDDQEAIGWARRALNPPANLPTDDPAVKLRKALGQHAYVHTLFFRALSEAQQFGVLNPAMYLWLRTTDRALWYTLHNVGRITPFPEAAATFQHFRAEKRAERDGGLMRPYTRGLTDALKYALEDLAYSEEEANPPLAPRRRAGPPVPPAT